MTNTIFSKVPRIITTKRLCLRLPQAGDGALLYAAMLDGYDDCVYWLNWPKTPPSIAQIEEDCKKHSVGFSESDGLRYLIVNSTTNQIMGRIAYPPAISKWNIPTFGISYFIAKSFQGKNYATEAAASMTKMAFEVLKARKVKITVDPDNIASAKIPLKLGFELEARQKGEWFRVDKPLAELHTYALFDMSLFIERVGY